MFFFSSRRRHTRYWRDWSSDVCSSDLRKRELVDEVTIGLVKHSVAEETRVYPRVEEQVDREEAEHSKHEHAEAEETMKRLERMEPDDPQFDTEVATLIREIRHHVEHEESRMFTELRATFKIGR